MNKKIRKILIITIYIIFIVSLFSNVFAAVNDFKGTISGTGATNAKKSAVTILSSILNIIRTAGASSAVTILIVIACKYIIASAGDRADIKKYAVNYIIGALILFGAAGIASIIRNFVNSAVAV
jgi:type IV secretory pathway VirB2 component (pilin)